MYLSRLPKTISLAIVLLFLAGLPTYAFTATDFNSSIEVGEIDIAPTDGPVPSPKRNQRPIQPRGETQQRLPSVIQNRPLNKTTAFFSLSLTSLDADFGVVDPTNPVIRTQRLSLEPGTSQNFSLFLYENHPLQIKNTQNFIPDTTCDDGRCTEKTASVWENTLTYGFGFRCDHDGQKQNPCAHEFSHQQFYKQFADVSKKEPGAQLLNGEADSRTVQARITYKLNVSGTQAKGIYENALVFIAAPRF